MGIGEAARRLHEKEFDARHLAGHLLHIAAQDGREIGIDHGGVAAADELHHRAGFMRGADLREADFCRNALGGFFMIGIPVAMHEYDGNTAQPLLILRK